MQGSRPCPARAYGYGGGAATAMQFVRAGLVDEYRISIIPMLLGAGIRFFSELDGTRRLILTGVSESGGIAELKYVSSP